MTKRNLNCRISIFTVYSDGNIHGSTCSANAAAIAVIIKTVILTVLFTLVNNSNFVDHSTKINVHVYVVLAFTIIVSL